MPIVPARALTALALLASAGLTLSGCSSATNGHPIGTGVGPASTGATDTGAPPTGTAPNTGAAPSDTSAPAGTLSKPEFLSQMNGECNEIIAKLAAVPVPSALDDYAGIERYGTVSLQLFPPYLAKAKSLVARSADQAELTTKWVSIEESDYQASAPLLVQLVAAAHQKDSAKVSAVETQLEATPDHSEDIAAFMTDYGLTDCASLESS
jgi:hypothetical protein